MNFYLQEWEVIGFQAYKKLSENLPGDWKLYGAYLYTRAPSQHNHHLNIYIFLILAIGCMACGILVPQPEIELRPWQWKHWVLTIGLPGNFPTIFCLIL